MNTTTRTKAQNGEYFRLALEAAYLERIGLFASAYPLWTDAAEHAINSSNKLWAQRRSELCKVLNLRSLSNGAMGIMSIPIAKIADMKDKKR